jgi:hypothetical protein
LTPVAMVCNGGGGGGGWGGAAKPRLITYTHYFPS